MLKKCYLNYCLFEATSYAGNEQIQTDSFAIRMLEQCGWTVDLLSVFFYKEQTKRNE